MAIKIISLIGIFIFFVGTHTAMLTHYKPFRYFWNYFSDLSYENNWALSRLLNLIAFVILGCTLILIWWQVAMTSAESALLFKFFGFFGGISIACSVLVPYKKYQRAYSVTHGALVMTGNISTNICILLVNTKLQNWYLWVALAVFVIYFLVWAVSSRVYKNNEKMARPWHAPVQKAYVLFQVAALIVVI